MSFWDEGPSKTVRILIFVGIGCVLPGVFLGPLFSAVLAASKEQTDGRYGSICLSRLRIIGQAMSMYGEDNDGRFPIANSWIDSTFHYVLKEDPKNVTENPYQCPTISKKRVGDYGYSMNIIYSREELVKFKETGHTAEPLIFDADEVGRNAHSTIKSLSLPPRHGEGKINNALYPDLSAKTAPPRFPEQKK